MQSRIWKLDPSESYENPYDYADQFQFQREAGRILQDLYHLLNGENNRYSIDDQSISKACWLLVMEAMDCLRESLAALHQKRHRVFSALLRTVHEVLDLTMYFHEQGRTKKGERRLKAWYRDEIIGHKVYRGWIKKRDGSDADDREAAKYSTLSRFTHRSYGILLYGYSLGEGGRLVHDATGELFGNGADSRTMLVLPQTLAMYYAILAQSILAFVKVVGDLALIDPETVNKAMRD